MRRPASGPAPGDGGVRVEGLRVDAVAYGVDIVDDVCFAVEPGAALGVVGESGCGKTTVAMSLLGYSRPGTAIRSGSIEIGGVDIAGFDEAHLRGVRGRWVSFVPQNPAKALSPGMRVGRQLDEMLGVDGAIGPAERRSRVRAAFASAQLPTDDAFLERYPHQLSGGQKQRVAIAMAFVCDPHVIVMDEPTTGLDVVTQARLLDVIRELRSGSATAIVYVSHDLGVVRNLVDRVAVMYGGRLVEEAPVDRLFSDPRHPYTRRLLEAIPRLHERAPQPRGIPGSAVEPWERPAGCPFAPRCEFRLDACETAMPPTEREDGSLVRCIRTADVVAAPYAAPAIALGRSPADAHTAESPVLVVTELRAGYRAPRRLFGSNGHRYTEAVAGVSLELRAGACLAIVGESGSGKTTLARCIAGLHVPSGGEMTFAGTPLAPTAAKRAPETRRQIQIVFQDPDSSLNPSMTVGQSVERPLRQFFEHDRTARAAAVAELLECVRLPASMADRYPRDLSGGEKQRVALARALAAEPRLLICDEVTSALDVAVQASILSLLDELRASLGMSLLFVSHDLAVVRAISDAVIVMQAGRACEEAPADQLFRAPSSSYTHALLEAVPDLLPGDFPPVAA